MPYIEEHDVLLKVFACGVCGTDVRKVTHRLVEKPTVLGHEVAGEIVEIGKAVQKFRVGDRVVVAHHTPCYECLYCKHGNFSMCRKFKSSNLDPGGFAEYLRIPKDHVELTAFKIPDHLSYEQAIFMEPLACVVRNLNRTKILSGDTVLIIGLGSMGLLTGQLLLEKGATVIATDLKDDRIALARKLGFNAAFLAHDPDLRKNILELTEGRGADLVVLTAGSAETYSTSTQYLRDGGSLNIFAGLSPGTRISFDANEIYSREITIYSSYSPSPEDLKESLHLLSEKKINVDILNSKSFSLHDTEKAIHAVARQEVLKAIIHPFGASA